MASPRKLTAMRFCLNHKIIKGMGGVCVRKESSQPLLAYLLKSFSKNRTRELSSLFLSYSQEDGARNRFLISSLMTLGSRPVGSYDFINRVRTGKDKNPIRAFSQSYEDLRLLLGVLVHGDSFNGQTWPLNSIK